MQHIFKQAADPIVREATLFCHSSMQASASIFFWLAPGLESCSFSLWGGLPKEMMDIYFNGMGENDPLEISRVLKGGQPFVFQKEHSEVVEPSKLEAYRHYHASFELEDEMDFVFSTEGEPFALLAVLKRPSDPPFAAQPFDFGAIHRYLEFNC